MLFKISVFIRWLFDAIWLWTWYYHSLIYLDFLSCVFCLDVSSNQVTFRIQEQWDQKYSDPATKEYVNLKQQMVEKVN